MSDYHVTVVPHTHWDREWYQPFSVFQARLVATVDRVLELLEEGERFRHFMLDGQAVVLEDYLAVRPEAKVRMQELVGSGRLAIGPWYTLPDEFLASPEALVRNLLVGGRVCRTLGEPMAVAYTPDSFGHISQLPLLAAGFGFDSLVFERGVGDEGERLRGEFRWSSPNRRTSVLAVHLITTYSSGAALGYADWEHYRDFDPERAVAHARKAIHGGDEPVGMAQWLDESLARVPGGAAAYASGPNLLFLNGSDHLMPQHDLPETLELLAARMPEAEFRLGGLREYVEALQGQRGELPHYTGEFRGSRYHHVLSGVFSARLYLKKANQAAEQWLERYAEPLSALAALDGRPYPAAVLEDNWKELLKNHAHDSICGCSIDQVHDEMMPRFRGVSAASWQLSRQAIAHFSEGEWERAPVPLFEGTLRSPAAAREPLLTVFNPHPTTWRGVLEARMALPSGVADPDSVLDRSGGRVTGSVTTAAEAFPGDARVEESIAEVRWLAELAPLSLTTFRLGDGRETGPDSQPSQEGSPQGAAGGKQGVAGAGRQEVRVAGGRLESDLLVAELRGDSLLLTPAGGEPVAVTLVFEDRGDAGDEYDFSPVLNDEPITLRLSDLDEIAADCDGLVGEMILAGNLVLPEGLAEDRSRREGEVEVPVRLTLSLSAADPFLRLDVAFDNRARDHRLQLVAHSDVVSDSVWVEGHFDVLERPARTPAAPHWFQKPSGTNHQRRFAAVGDGSRGLAVLNAGLPEYGSEAGDAGTSLAVTLLRSVGWLSRNDMISRPEGAGPAIPTPGAQCLGPQLCRLGLMPFSGDWRRAEVPEAAERFTVAPLVEASAGYASGHGLLELPRGLLLSALKQPLSGRGLLVRAWNPGTETVTGELRLSRPATRAQRARLDEQPLEGLPAGTDIPVSVDAKDVVTVLLEFGGEAMA